MVILPTRYVNPKGQTHLIFSGELNSWSTAGSSTCYSNTISDVSRISSMISNITFIAQLTDPPIVTHSVGGQMGKEIVRSTGKSLPIQITQNTCPEQLSELDGVYQGS